MESPQWLPGRQMYSYMESLRKKSAEGRHGPDTEGKTEKSGT